MRCRDELRRAPNRQATSSQHACKIDRGSVAGLLTGTQILVQACSRWVTLKPCLPCSPAGRRAVIGAPTKKNMRGAPVFSCPARPHQIRFIRSGSGFRAPCSLACKFFLKGRSIYGYSRTHHLPLRRHKKSGAASTCTSAVFSPPPVRLSIIITARRKPLRRSWRWAAYTPCAPRSLRPGSFTAISVTRWKF